MHFSYFSKYSFRKNPVPVALQAHNVAKKSKVDGERAGGDNVTKKPELDKNYMQKFEKRCKHRYDIFDKALEEGWFIK